MSLSFPVALCLINIVANENQWRNINGGMKNNGVA